MGGDVLGLQAALASRRSVDTWLASGLQVACNLCSEVNNHIKASTSPTCGQQRALPVHMYAAALHHNGAGEALSSLHLQRRTCGREVSRNASAVQCFTRQEHPTGS